MIKQEELETQVFLSQIPEEFREQVAAYLEHNPHERVSAQIYGEQFINGVKGADQGIKSIAKAAGIISPESAPPPTMPKAGFLSRLGFR